MSYHKDLLSDLREIIKIVFEIGKTNKFDNMEFKDIIELAEVIYHDYDYIIHGDVQGFARTKLNEIIELEEMII